MKAPAYPITQSRAGGRSTVQRGDGSRHVAGLRDGAHGLRAGKHGSALRVLGGLGGASLGHYPAMKGAQALANGIARVLDAPLGDVANGVLRGVGVLADFGLRQAMRLQVGDEFFPVHGHTLSVCRYSWSIVIPIRVFYRFARLDT